MTFAEWARRYNARVIKKLAEAKEYPNEPVAFETRNFGWIFSACDENGARRLVAKE